MAAFNTATREVPRWERSRSVRMFGQRWLVSGVEPNPSVIGITQRHNRPRPFGAADFNAGEEVEGLGGGRRKDDRTCEVS